MFLVVYFLIRYNRVTPSVLRHKEIIRILFTITYLTKFTKQIKYLYKGSFPEDTLRYFSENIFIYLIYDFNLDSNSFMKDLFYGYMIVYLDD